LFSENFGFSQEQKIFAGLVNVVSI